MTSSRQASASAAVADEASPAADRILAAATRFFLQFGYEGTSITKIAKEAGMTPANIYWHYPSKLDLLREVLHALYGNAYLNLASAVGDGRAEERLTEYVKAFVAMQLTSTDARSNFGYTSLASALKPEDQSDLAQAGRPYIDLLGEILRQGIDEGAFDIKSITITALAITNMCETVFTWFREDGQLDAEASRGLLLELALRMASRR